MKEALEKKKRLFFLIGLAALVVVCAVVLAVIFWPKAPDYTFAPFQDEFDSAGKFISGDSKVSFDGKLDDKAWKNQRWLEVAQTEDPNIQVKMTSYFGEDGLYMAFDVDDIGVFDNVGRSPALNSGIQLYLSSMEGAEDITGHGYEIMLTAGGTIQVNQYIAGGYSEGAGRVYLASRTKGKLNSMECKGYTMEVFFGYNMLGDNHEMVYASPAIVRSDSESGEGRQWYWFGEELRGSSWTKANTWWSFDKAGLVALDVKLSGDENGALAGNDYVVEGDDYTFQIEPKEGYYASQITVNGQDMTDEILYDNGKACCILEQVKEQLEVKAEFAKLPQETVNISGKVTDGANPVEGATAWAVKNGFTQPLTLAADGSYTAAVPAVKGLKVFAQAKGWVSGIAEVPESGKADVVLCKFYFGTNENVNMTAQDMDKWDFTRLYENRVRLRAPNGSYRLINSEIYSDSVYVSSDVYLPEKQGVDGRAGYCFLDEAGNSVFIALTMNGEVNEHNPEGKIYYSLQVISNKNGNFSWGSSGTLDGIDKDAEIRKKANRKEGVSLAVHYSRGVFDIWINDTQVGFGVVPVDAEGNRIFKADAKMATGLENWVIPASYRKLEMKGNYPKRDPNVVDGWDMSKLNQGIAKALAETTRATILGDYRNVISMSANIPLPLESGKDTRAGFYFRNKRGDDVFVALTMNGEKSKYNPEGKLYYTLQMISKGWSSWRCSGEIADISTWGNVVSKAKSDSGVPVSVYVENGSFTIGIDGCLVASGIYPADENGKNIFAGDTALTAGLETTLRKVTFTKIAIGSSKPVFKTMIGPEWNLSGLSKGEAVLNEGKGVHYAMLWQNYRDKLYIRSNIVLKDGEDDPRVGYRFVDEKGNKVFVCLLLSSDGTYDVQIISQPITGSWGWHGCKTDKAAADAAKSDAGVPFEAAYKDGKISVWINNSRIVSDFVLQDGDGRPLFAEGAKVSGGLECWNVGGVYHKLQAYDKRP